MSASGRQLIAGRFEIADPERDLIGRGAVGDVYRAMDLHSGKHVAVKALRPEAVAAAPNAIARFIREGEALGELDHHNIVKLVDTYGIIGLACCRFCDHLNCSIRSVKGDR